MTSETSSSKRDFGREKPEGLIFALGLGRAVSDLCRSAAATLNATGIDVGDIHTLKSLLDGDRPTVVVVTAGDYRFPHLLDQSNPLFRRTDIVSVTEHETEAERLSLAGLVSFSKSASVDVARLALAAALRTAETRRRDWDRVDEFCERLASLSRDELEVMQAVCDGKLNKQIATSIGASIRTVEQRRRRVFKKMRVDSAVPLAREFGFIQTLARRLCRHDQPHEMPRLRIFEFDQKAAEEPPETPRHG